MSIIVVCPGCRKSFKVNDKFAGKSGPCPNCKRTLQVPTQAQEVKVHAPEEFAGGGKTASGKLAIKPVAFMPTKASPVMTIMIVASVVIVFALTLAGRYAGLFQGTYWWIAATIGLLLISPPLVVAAYSVLRDTELEPYRGKELYLRSALCALGYAALWVIFTLLARRFGITGDLWNWLYIAPPFVIMGGLFALATLDLDFGDCLFHYGFYLLATVILRWAAGMKWVWDITS